MKKVDVIIVAAGKSQRFGSNKLLFKLSDYTVIEKTINAFLNIEYINKIIVVCSKEVEGFLNKNNNITLTMGGQTRSESVKKGLELVESNYVMIHDGARPFVLKKLINELYLEILKNNYSVIPMLKINDCLKYKSESISTVNREMYFITQTPQTFNSILIKELYSIETKTIFNDDCEIIEQFGDSSKIKFVDGSKTNIKITFKEDLQ